MFSNKYLFNLVQKIEYETNKKIKNAYCKGITFEIYRNDEELANPNISIFLDKDFIILMHSTWIHNKFIKISKLKSKPKYFQLYRILLYYFNFDTYLEETLNILKEITIKILEDQNNKFEESTEGTEDILINQDLEEEEYF